MDLRDFLVAELTQSFGCLGKWGAESLRDFRYGLNSTPFEKGWGAFPADGTRSVPATLSSATLELAFIEQKLVFDRVNEG